MGICTKLMRGDVTMNKKVEHELKSANRLAKNDAVSTIVQDLDGAELVVLSSKMD